MRPATWPSTSATTSNGVAIGGKRIGQFRHALFSGGTVGLAVARNCEFVPVQLVEQIDGGGAVGFCVGANGEGHG